MFNWKKALVSGLLVSGFMSQLQEEANAQKQLKVEKLTIATAETINTYKNPNAYSVTGKGTAGAAIKVVLSDGKSSVSAQSIVKKDGTFTVPVNFSKLKDGKLSLSISQLKNGKTIASVTKTVLKDTKSPVVPILNNALYIYSKNQSAYTVKGKAEPNSKVYVSIGDQKTNISQNGKADKKGNFILTLDARKLQEGKINLTAGSMDAAGNKTSYSKPGFLTKDTQIEEPLVVSEEYVNSFNVESYPIAGTGTPGDNVKIMVNDGAKTISEISEVDELGNYEVDLDLTLLKEGNLTIDAKQLDQAGNESKEVRERVIKDVSAPSSATIFNNGYINEDTDLTSYSIIGRGEAGSELEITLSDGVNEVSSLGTVEENGRFSVEVDASPLSDGEITIYAVQISKAGNVGEADTAAVFKDITAPDSPAVNELEAISQLNSNSYNISGKGEKGSSIFITVTDGKNSLFEKVKANIDESFNATVDLSVLNNGEITFIILQKDQAGNVSKSIKTTAVKSS